MSSMMRKKSYYYPDITRHFLKRESRIESSKEPESVPSASAMSEIAGCPQSPITDDSLSLPSPVSNSSCLFT